MSSCGVSGVGPEPICRSKVGRNVDAAFERIFLERDFQPIDSIHAKCPERSIGLAPDLPGYARHDNRRDHGARWRDTGCRRNNDLPESR